MALCFALSFCVGRKQASRRCKHFQRLSTYGRIGVPMKHVRYVTAWVFVCFHMANQAEVPSSKRVVDKVWFNVIAYYRYYKNQRINPRDRLDRRFNSTVTVDLIPRMNHILILSLSVIWQEIDKISKLSDIMIHICQITLHTHSFDAHRHRCCNQSGQIDMGMTCLKKKKAKPIPQRRSTRPMWVSG